MSTPPDIEARRRRSRASLVAALVAAIAVGGIFAGTMALKPSRDSPPAEADGEAAAVDVPEQCIPAASADRDELEGSPAWVRFCPGPPGLTAPAETPSDALTTHLDSLDGLVLADARRADAACRARFSRTYRVQVGFDDGTVAEISGRTDPSCPGQTRRGASVTGPSGLGVYGALMKAFGQQYADQFTARAPSAPLACPDDPRDPDSTNLDGSSTELGTGFLRGAREPMTMPLPAVRGILCTWSTNARGPTSRDLTADEAERVRIGLHAIHEAMVDCSLSPGPTYTAIVEDKTGTRRAVTIVESECSTVIRSDGGYGLGFAWLDR